MLCIRSGVAVFQVIAGVIVLRNLSFVTEREKKKKENFIYRAGLVKKGEKLIGMGGRQTT